jgi:agmatine deiminase
MPAETDPQDRIWLAWPSAGYTLAGQSDGEAGADAVSAEEARITWAAVANAAASFEPVTVIVDPADTEIARRYLDSQIELREAPLNDAWMRDIGPTFVIGDTPDGPVLGAVDWVFNGWGAQSWARWDKDEKIGAKVAEFAGATIVESPLVNEGGGIHVDGSGTVLLTETVQLDPGRNPGLDRAAVEAELARTIGAVHFVWLPRGLERDSQTYGTRGHVDIVATIPSPGVLLLHDQRDEGHPDHAVTGDLRALLSQAEDSAGRAFEIVDLPAPAGLRDAGGFVDYSYVNHLVVNGGVIACSFGDENDADAVAILRDAYPGRQVVSVDARPLFERGGGIHCITQQQPSLPGS